ncbi:peptide deformylase [Corynebacterium uberis]|uniref:peptide deformylase n=1 Tax=Corynebacterium TaxID=1716 RepID=UPI001D0ACD24|nr:MULTISPECIES: peptide deformylase [Corynebacterium]MCZ9308585.1 peptide deformylase [Corynebacterium sp. c6VSa_13]UDL74234.1 peptide deformylase [Corynebacterium uberis]UDL74886.1 peptide deformylase [Corynebacterium uberis]UDL77100.1 peptide deformylase [Corynebacterium uberis]UDL79383.1 peptide deformylase [Corynebacterium uberis]
MTLRKIRLFGDPVLSTRADEVHPDDAPALRGLIDDMVETMKEAGGVGLAANQVGVLKRVFVFDCTHVESGMRGHIINPVWEPVGEQLQQGSEGCLSIPGVSLPIERYQQVRVSGIDVAGRPVTLTASGLLARCIQHETDHLDGVLFLRRAAAQDRRAAMAQIRSSSWWNSQG